MPGGGFHSSGPLGHGPDGLPCRLWATDEPGSPAGVLVAGHGHVLTADEAWALGTALVAAADTLRREARASRTTAP
jgi:hypothetical protein